MAKKKQLKYDSCKALFPEIEIIRELSYKHKALIHASNILKKAEECTAMIIIHKM